MNDWITSQRKWYEKYTNGNFHVERELHERIEEFHSADWLDDDGGGGYKVVGDNGYGDKDGDGKNNLPYSTTN